MSQTEPPPQNLAGGVQLRWPKMDLLKFPFLPISVLKFWSYSHSHGIPTRLFPFPNMCNETTE